MQRRRRPKAEPKDIFGTGSQTKPAKKEEPKPRKTQSSAPEPVPGPPPAIGIKLEAGSIPDEAGQAPQEVFPEPISTEDEESVVESQILGGPKRKSIGLQPIADGKPTETQAQSISPKAQELIEESGIEQANLRKSLTEGPMRLKKRMKSLLALYRGP